MTSRLPVHAPINHSLDAAFVGRILGRKEARRLVNLLTDADRQARAAILEATREAEKILADARAEAETILAMLPDFAAIGAAPASKGKSAFSAIRAVADRHGVAMAAVTGKGRDLRAKSMRAEAICAVADACPTMTDADIGRLFSNLPAASVRRIRAEGGQ